MRAGDLILIGLCALLVGGVYGVAWQAPARAGWAELHAPDAAPRRIPLDGDRRVAVAGRRGDSVLAVSGGRARFVSSPCASKHCIHAGWLDAAGDFAACLPNGVSVTLVSARQRYDALAY